MKHVQRALLLACLVLAGCSCSVTSRPKAYEVVLSPEAKEWVRHECMPSRVRTLIAEDALGWCHRAASEMFPSKE